MQDKELEKEEEKLVDLKGTIEAFVEEEKPELSQEEAIKAYRKGDIIEYPKKKKKNTSTGEEEDENEDDAHLKRVKRELLESLERVNALEKKIFTEKDKENLKNIKVKSGTQKSKNREQVIEQMREKVQEENEKSRE